MARPNNFIFKVLLDFFDLVTLAALEARDISAEQIAIMPKGQARAYAANGLIEPLNRKATVRLVPVASQSRDS